MTTEDVLGAAFNAYRDDVLKSLLGQRVIAAAVKRLKTDNHSLEGPSVLLLALENGLVLTFKNGDGDIYTTGGLDNDGWHYAMTYCQDIMEVAHFAKLEDNPANDGKASCVHGSYRY